MANLFKKIYTGTLAKYVAATKDENSLYMVYDEDTLVKSIYKGTTKVAGDFIIATTTPETPEQGVIYYISEFGKEEAEGEVTKEGYPFVGFYDGENWVPMSDSSEISDIVSRLDILEGDDETEGSVAKSIKDAVEALDYEDAEVPGSVVVAVNEVDGVIETSKQPMSVVKVADTDKAEGMSAEYQIKIGDTALETKISIPYAESVLTNAVLSDMNATVSETDGTVTAGDPKGADALVMVFKKADGTYVGVKVDVSTILMESEFKDGLEVSENGEVSVKIAADDDYLGLVADSTDPDANKFVAAKIGSFTEYDEDGSVKTAAVKGLADVIDVEKVITDNEKVTAAALNDLDTRIGANDSLETEAKVVVDAINELKSSIEDKNVDAEGDDYVSASAEDNKVTVAATESTIASLELADSAVQSVSEAAEGQEVTVTTTVDEENPKGSKSVTIGVTKAAYTAATFDENTGDVTAEGEFTQDGLVDNSTMVSYVSDEIASNGIYWETL